MRNLIFVAGALALAACGHVTVEAPFAKQSKHEPLGWSDSAPNHELQATQMALLDRYFEIYKAKDVDAMLALYDDDIMGVLHPATLFGKGIEAARPGIEGDFETRPEAYAEISHRYRIARDKWVAFGESINGEERAPLWILFDLGRAGDKIEATYTQVGAAAMIEGASVDQPTEAMRASWAATFAALSAGDFAAAAEQLAEGAVLYSYPPSKIEDHGPVVAGSSDVASVLAFKWGEGAWREDIFVSQYKQFVFVGIPGEGRDRVALFSFGADPEGADFEKITRVDVMGPSGG